MKVQDVMTSVVRSCQSSDRAHIAAQIMWEADCGCVPVVDAAAHVMGMVTDRDLAMAAFTQGRRLDEIPVATVMTKKVQVVSPKDDLASAQQLMQTAAVRRLPVVEDGRLVGILSINDLTRVAAQPASKKAKDLSAEDVTATLAAIGQPRQATKKAAKKVAKP